MRFWYAQCMLSQINMAQSLLKPMTVSVVAAAEPLATPSVWMMRWETKLLSG